MTISWVFSPKLLSIKAYFRELTSSKAASVSSKTRNGGGLTCDIAKSKEMATSDLSPPDSISNEEILFLGWLTEISMPVSSGFGKNEMSFSSNAKKGEEIIFSLSDKEGESSENDFFSLFTNLNSAFPPPKTETKNLLNSSFIFSTPPKKSFSILSASSAIISRKDFSATAKSLSSFSYP